ncbi:MAG TPA: threonine--tRNA ligase, partial [Chthoniobacteraceae bacterium]
GHLPYYAESMFPPMELEGEDVSSAEDLERLKRANDAWRVVFDYLDKDLETIESMVPGGNLPDSVDVALARRADREQVPDSVKQAATDFRELGRQIGRPKGDRYYLKAMNCPHHHKLFGAVPRSYRDLPLRLAEYGTCYRYEQSGELFGLMRVRSMQMNDAHIYCTEEQFEAEFNAVNELYLKYFKIFGIEKYLMRFSTHDPEKLGQKFVDAPELWQRTETMVRNALVASGINFVEVPNEAAFYGPKIDVQVWSAIGREFTIATNQVDFAMPGRFKLKYKTAQNTEETPLCIHRAPLGTHERFIGFLIEHYAGNFPLWLAPEQVRVLPIGDEEPLVRYAREIHAELRGHGIRAKLDTGTDPIKAKIADAEQMKVHHMLVIGHRDLEAGQISVRVHGKGNLGAKPRADVVAELLATIQERRA